MRRLFIALVIFLSLPVRPAAAGPSSASCAASTSTTDVNAYLASKSALLHGDYQRSLQLADGRVLWTFQDAFVNAGGGRTRLIHNAGLLQTGPCFQLLRGGSDGAPAAWLMAEPTTPFHRWFWPLDSSIASDGTIRIFMAEMRELGNHYLAKVEPVATWIVTVSPTDLSVLDARPAPDSTPSLYGWSITSDERWTYLYGYCYRQFGWDPIPFSATARGHDLGCSADVYVARVHRGHLEEPPSYWNGAAWTSDASAAAPALPRAGRAINPAQVRWTGREFVAVTKVGDWWGNTVVVDVAPSAHGPWTTTTTLKVDPLCDKCNTYFASIVTPSGSSGDLTIGLSNNRWDGRRSAAYHPTLMTVAWPRTKPGSRQS
ncbi:MAG TPA: hypothetical protein VH761_10355 [Ilumatobacteraceae bacterium]|jgi:hypothetical protein